MAVMRCADDIKPIAPILKRMQVYDFSTWPVSRLLTISATVGRLHTQFKDEGRRFRIEQDGRKVIVQRMK